MYRRLADTTATILLAGAGLVSSLILLLIVGDILVQGIRVVSPSFIFTSPRGIEMRGGIFPTIIASFYVTFLAMLVVSPLGIGAAIYLSEYAKEGRVVRLIRFGADALASVPSIVFGLFGLALFVDALGFGWSMLSGGLTLAIMILPIVMRTTEEALLAVPPSYAAGSLALGATKWQTIRYALLPAASARIVTGIILGTGRAIGETAAVLFTAGLAVNTPILLTDSGRTMTNHLFLLATEGISLGSAYGTALVLIVVILIFNLVARKMLARV